MQRVFRAIALSTLMVFGQTMVARAAEQSTVTVALFDMTAVGQGMMGQGAGGFGMMGRGGFGQGMMGQNFGRSFGSMMGPGMMSIRSDKSSVKAGDVTFNVTNWSRSIVHEMLVIAVDSADAPLPYDYDKQQVIEEQVRVLGEAEALEPNASKALSLNLEAGTYLLICNVPGHYGAGMQTVLTVTP